MNLMLLGDYDGKGGVCAAHVLKGLRERHLRVQEDQVHHHAHVSHLPAYRLRILSVHTHGMVL